MTELPAHDTCFEEHGRSAGLPLATLKPEPQDSRRVEISYATAVAALCLPCRCGDCERGLDGYGYWMKAGCYEEGDHKHRWEARCDTCTGRLNGMECRCDRPYLLRRCILCGETELQDN
jgi:hypothetical protein